MARPMADNSLKPTSHLQARPIRHSRPLRHSREGGNPAPAVIPAHSPSVIPAQAGIQQHGLNIQTSLDSRLRGNDGFS